MASSFNAFCDDFYVNMRLGSQMALPNGRETVLHFLERIQKDFPTMGRFRRNENGDTHLEEDRSQDSYRWVGLEQKRLTAGHVNPPSIDEALRLHSLLLQLAPYQLGLSNVEIDHLDVLFGFDLEYAGNHDDVVADSLLTESPLLCLMDLDGARPIDVQPSVTLALSPDCRLQARIDIVTRTSSYQVRTGDYNADAISVYLIMRRYWGDRPTQPMEEMLKELAARGEALCESFVVPRVVKALSTAISSRS